MPLTVMLKVEGRRCLVVGGGKVGVRKARGLMDEGATVTILSSSLTEHPPGVDFMQERYSSQHLDDMAPWLVVAATDDPQVNQQIDEDARARGILTMLVDNPAAGDVRVSLPAVMIVSRWRYRAAVRASRGIWRIASSRVFGPKCANSRAGCGRCVRM